MKEPAPAHRPRTGRHRAGRPGAGGLFAAALPVLALILSGCGGGSPATPRTTTITVTPSTSAPRTTPPSSTTTTPAVTAPTTYDQALAHLSTGKVDAQAPSTFTSPTGNIYCDISASSAATGCELKAGRIPPPTAAYCGGAQGGGAQDIGRIEFGADGPRAICNSDTMVTPGQKPALKYGSISKVAGSPLQCISESIGMTCVDTTKKKGFFLARDKFFIF